MLDTRHAIERQLAAGEDSRFELWSGPVQGHHVNSPDSESLARSMVAFANLEGGVILLGIDEYGIVRGLLEDRLKDIQRWVVNMAARHCTPSIRPIIREEQLAGSGGRDATVILVEVQKGLFVHATSNGQHFERVGSTVRVVSGTRLARLFHERSRECVFDHQPVPTATLDDLEGRKLKKRFNRRDHSVPWLDLLRNTGIVASTEGDLLRPTVAGLLAFGKAPGEHLPSAYIDASVCQGSELTSDELVHADRIRGCIDDQIEGAAAFVERFMLKPARERFGRSNHAQFDMSAVREAIVNAVMHRQYSVSGSGIRLRLYADRLELYSPGSLPGTLTVETMAYRVFTRNQLLAHFLSRMNSLRTGQALVESRGGGVRKILSTGRSHSGRTPIYKLHGGELVLTIWARTCPRQAGDAAEMD